MRRSRIIQKLETACARWVDKCPLLVLLALGIFTLAANLTANTIWEAVEVSGAAWNWATCRIWLYVLPFLVTLFFLYFIARPLFTIHTIHKEAEVRRHLILFLSFLGKDDDQVQLELAKTCGINPDLLKRLTFDSLYLDLEEMVVWKNQGKPFWSWEMPLRAICWHRPGQTLQSVSLVCSDKSITQVQWFLDICRRYPDTDLAQETAQVAAARDQALQAQDPARLLELEGSGARAYFAAFAKMVRYSFGFSGRARHPAPDPVNALLSLGYTMVYNELSSLLDGLGFDPFLGFYHQPRFGHATLASDLLEEFRAPLVDRFTLYLINNRILQEPDFYSHTSGGVYLLDEPRKRYFQEYERFVTRPQSAAADEPDLDFRRLFRRQAERLRQTLLTGEPYDPFPFSWN